MMDSPTADNESDSLSEFILPCPPHNPKENEMTPLKMIR